MAASGVANSGKDTARRRPLLRLVPTPAAAEASAAEHAGEEPEARGAEEYEYVGSRVC